MQKTTIFLSIVVLLAMIAMGAYIWQNEQDKDALLARLASPAPTPVEVPSTIPETETTPVASEATDLKTEGTITGSLSFPSEVIPEMEICAESTTTNQQFCTTEMLKDSSYTYGVGYRLDVPADTYHVFAKLPNDPYRAYYNEFVECGLRADCESHTQIDVKVTTGSTISGIDPQDWYNRQEGE